MPLKIVMLFKRSLRLLPLAITALLLGACAEDVVVEQSFPDAPQDTLAFDAQKASAGKVFYDEKCKVCHGSDGLSTLYPSITHPKYGTKDAVDAKKLMTYTEANMPPLSKGKPNECNSECADAIQNYFYQQWSKGGATSSAASSAVGVNSSSAASSVAAIVPADRNVPNFKGAVDAAKVIAGKILYTEKKCNICHGSVGGYDGEKLTPPTQSPIHNNLAYYVSGGKKFDDLFFVIHDAMPPGAAMDCETTCAENVAEYIKSWTAATGEYVPVASASSASIVASSSVSSVSSAAAISSSSLASSSSVQPSSSAQSSSSAPSSPSAAEVTMRVAAGKTLYEKGNICVFCHGADGTVTTSDKIVDTQKSYAEIVAIVANGTGSMPACAPAGNCAAPIADYIWVQFLGRTLAQ